MTYRITRVNHDLLPDRFASKVGTTIDAPVEGWELLVRPIGDHYALGLIQRGPDGSNHMLLLTAEMAATLANTLLIALGNPDLAAIFPTREVTEAEFLEAKAGRQAAELLSKIFGAGTVGNA